MSIDFSTFETIIGYHFQNPDLLNEALSHSSFVNERKKTHHCNERLEFLGDSVLSVVVSNYLFHAYPDIPEGRLTRLRAALVCEQSLHRFALQIHLGEYLQLGKGEERTGGRSRPSILADAFEAVIAAMYLDSDLEQVTQYILGFLPDHLPENQSLILGDYKTVLQEVIQKNPEEKVEYVLVGETGPDHNKTFQVEVFLNSNSIGSGTGKSKKQAEQMAAKEALELMGYDT